MNKSKVLLVIGFLVAVNTIIVVNFLRGRSSHPRTSSYVRELYADRNQLISRDLEGQAIMSRGQPINLVGNLVDGGPYWSTVLKLTDEQKETIKKLNDIASEARNLALLRDAQPYEGDTSLRNEKIRANGARRNEAIAQAQRLVSDAIIDGDQATFVIHRYLKTVGFNALDQDRFVELLDLTPAQKQSLTQVFLDATEADYAANSLAVQAPGPIQAPDQPVPTAGPSSEQLRQGLKQSFDKSVRSVLTTAQQERWANLTAPLAPPALPSPDSRRLEPSGPNLVATARAASPGLRTLAEDGSTLNLGDDQKHLLADFEELVGQCLLWAAGDQATGSTDPAGKETTGAIARSRPSFLGAVERFIRFGILTEAQATKLDSLVKARAVPH